MPHDEELNKQRRTQEEVNKQSRTQNNSTERAKGLRHRWKSQEQFAIRVHARSRRKLFTPLDVKADDNIQGANFDGSRVTKGVYEDGTSFCVEDS